MLGQDEDLWKNRKKFILGIILQIQKIQVCWPPARQCGAWAEVWIVAKTKSFSLRRNLGRYFLSPWIVMTFHSMLTPTRFVKWWYVSSRILQLTLPLLPLSWQICLLVAQVMFALCRWCLHFAGLQGMFSGDTGDVCRSTQSPSNVSAFHNSLPVGSPPVLRLQVSK